MNKLLPLIVIPFISGCAYLKQIPETKIPLEIRIQRSNELIEQRKCEAESYSLEEKATFFEKELLEKFTFKNYLLVANFINSENADLTMKSEATAHYLAMLAYKYAATKDKNSVEKAKKIVDSLIALDESNKLDGYIPREASEKNGKIIPSPEKSRSNDHAMIMFGYERAYTLIDDPELKKEIRKHTELFVKRFLDRGMVMTDENGKEIYDTKLSPSRFAMSRSRCLDTLLFLELANYILDDETIRNKANEKIKECIKCGYLNKIQTLNIHLLNIQIPTHGTEWASIMTLHILTQISEKVEYKQALKRIFEDQKKENNPLYNSIYLLAFPEDKRREELNKTTEYYLSTFPLTLTNNEIINSKNKALKRKLFPPIVKNEYVQESITPLPIYMRSMDRLEWKRNPYRMDENLGAENGKIQYSGLDFLLAYWMHKYQLKKS